MDILIGDLLIDERGEQARRQLRVFGLFGDQLRRGLNRQRVELFSRGAVIKTADGFGGDL